MAIRTQTPKQYRFTGKERDQETGLPYFCTRYYAPWLGRWTSADPSEISHRLNPYLYCYSSSVQNVDPDIRFGLDFELFTEGVKEAVIGAPSGVGVMVVVEEATAVVAAPLILPAAVAPTLAAAATTAASAVTVVGLAATAKMGFEVARG